MHNTIKNVVLCVLAGGGLGGLVSGPLWWLFGGPCVGGGGSSFQRVRFLQEAIGAVSKLVRELDGLLAKIDSHVSLVSCLCVRSCRKRL